MKPDMEKIIEVLISLLEENRVSGRKEWTSSMNLKPETPLVVKLQIKRLEDECEMLRTRIWMLTIVGELMLTAVLLACVINFYTIT